MIFFVVVLALRFIVRLRFPTEVLIAIFCKNDSNDQAILIQVNLFSIYLAAVNQGPVSQM